MNDGAPTIAEANASAIQQALEAAGVVFIAENGGGAGVRLAKPKASDQPLSIPVDELTTGNDK